MESRHFSRLLPLLNAVMLLALLTGKQRMASLSLKAKPEATVYSGSSRQIFPNDLHFNKVVICLAFLCKNFVCVKWHILFLLKLTQLNNRKCGKMERILLHNVAQIVYAASERSRGLQCCEKTQHSLRRGKRQLFNKEAPEWRLLSFHLIEEKRCLYDNYTASLGFSQCRPRRRLKELRQTK